jgi:transcriptional regulator with XRE-family HTH domain
MRYLRHIREQQGLSQDQLSELSGVAQHNISKIERGLQKPTAKTLGKLAKALGVEEPSLLGLDLSSVHTFEELITGSPFTRQAFVEYKRLTGRLDSLLRDVEEIFAASVNDYRDDSLMRARLQAAYMLGYIQSTCDAHDVRGKEFTRGENEERFAKSS